MKARRCDQTQTCWPTNAQEELTPTREHARASVQATGPPVLGAVSAFNDLDAIANFEVKVTIGLRGEVVQRHNVVHWRRLGLERRRRWRCALRCRSRSRRRCR